MADNIKTINVKGKFTCEECSKELTSKTFLERHMKNVHHKNTEVLPTIPDATDDVNKQLDQENEVMTDAAIDQELLEAIERLSQGFNDTNKQKEAKELMRRY